MMKFHVGLKGAGKTKKLIDAVNDAVSIERGNVVCITTGDRLTYDIDSSARLVNTESFNIQGFEQFGGFLSGIIARDYDVTHIFIDSIFKSVGEVNVDDLDKFIPFLEDLNKKFDVKFTVMVTAEESKIGPNTKKYIA